MCINPPHFVLASILIFCFSFISLSQVDSPIACAQDDYLIEMINGNMEKEIQKRIIDISELTNYQNFETFRIPIKAHVIRKDNGLGGLSENELIQALHYVNEIFSNSPFEFYYSDIKFINSDQYYVLSNQAEGLQLYQSDNDQNALNIYFVSYLDTGYSGFARFPWFTDNRFAVVVNYAVQTYTYAHEIGHYLGLLHTHQGGGVELVDGSNCTTVGDLLCDTQASPQLSYSNVNSLTCNYIGTDTDANGDFYMPQTDNAMAYGPWECEPRQFTNDQITRMLFYYNSYVDSRQSQLAELVEYIPINSCLPGDDDDIDGICNANDVCTDAWDVDSDGDGLEDVCSTDCTPIDFNMASISSYAGDNGALYTMQEGRYVALVFRNAWKLIDINYNVTTNTKLCFDFKSTTEGEIHEISLEDGSDFTPLQRFILSGTQNLTDPVASFDYTYTQEGAYQHFCIPIGDYYTGLVPYLLLATDEDQSFTPANSYFRNVRIFEDTNNDNLCNSIILPVKFVEFTAELLDENVQLNWITNSEQNNAGFEIYRSFDGISFEYLDFVDSANFGFSTNQNEYTYTDLNVFQSTNKAFYYLRQVDFDGSFENTDIIQVDNINDKSGSILYPNPVQKGSDVNIYADNINKIDVYSMLGELLYSATYEDVQIVSINTFNFSSGIYLLKINDKEHYKLIIQ